MTPIYKTAEGERLVRERYLAFLKYWPVPNEHIRIGTSQGETFVVAERRGRLRCRTPRVVACGESE